MSVAAVAVAVAVTIVVVVVAGVAVDVAVDGLCALYANPILTMALLMGVGARGRASLEKPRRVPTFLTKNLYHPFLNSTFALVHRVLLPASRIMAPLSSRICLSFLLHTS